MEKTVNIHLRIPEEFSLQLDNDKLELKEKGSENLPEVLKKRGFKKLPSKEDLIIRYARIGRLIEIKNNSEQ